MKQFISKFWWLFPSLMAVLVLTLILVYTKTTILLTDFSVFENILWFLILVNLIDIVVSWIFLLLNKNWRKCLFSILLSLLIIVVLWIPLTLAVFNGADGFGKKHKIPEGLEYNLPLGSTYENGHKDVFDYSDNSPDVAVIDSLNPDTYLQIWNDFQGGMYKYSFFYPALPDGKLFLRCYEVTDDIELSASRLKTASTVEVKNHNKFGLIVDKQQFTIYEGDWDDYYLARVEVWFKEAKTHKETKLLEKIYRVEGWMR